MTSARELCDRAARKSDVALREGGLRGAVDRGHGVGPPRIAGPRVCAAVMRIGGIELIGIEVGSRVALRSEERAIGRIQAARIGPGVPEGAARPVQEPSPASERTGDADAEGQADLRARRAARAFRSVRAVAAASGSASEPAERVAAEFPDAIDADELKAKARIAGARDAVDLKLRRTPTARLRRGAFVPHSHGYLGPAGIAPGIGGVHGRCVAAGQRRQRQHQPGHAEVSHAPSVAWALGGAKLAGRDGRDASA